MPSDPENEATAERPDVEVAAPGYDPDLSAGAHYHEAGQFRQPSSFTAGFCSATRIMPRP